MVMVVMMVMVMAMMMMMVRVMMMISRSREIRLRVTGEFGGKLGWMEIGDQRLLHCIRNIQKNIALETSQSKAR